MMVCTPNFIQNLIFNLSIIEHKNYTCIIMSAFKLCVHNSNNFFAKNNTKHTKFAFDKKNIPQ